MNKSAFLEKLLIGGAPLSDEARAEAQRARDERRQRSPDAEDNFGEAPNEIVVGFRNPDEREDVGNLTTQELVQKIIQTSNDWEAERYLPSLDSVLKLDSFLEVLDLLADHGEARQRIWSSIFYQAAGLYTGEIRPNLSEAEINRRFLEFAGKNQAVTESAVYGLSEWLKIISNSIGTEDEKEFWALWDLLLPLSAAEPLGEKTDYVDQALNWSIGKLTEALLNRLWARNLKAGDDVDRRIADRLLTIATGDDDGHILGRLMLAAQLNPLFALVPEIAREHLIPRMNWNASPREACALWQGFLWTSTFSYDLWEALKENYLTAVPHAGDLGMNKESMAHVFAFVLTSNPETLSHDQIQRAFSQFDTGSLADIADRFRLSLEADDIDKADVWKNRITPWIDYWPGTNDKITIETSKALSRLIVVADEAIDDAFKS